MQHSPRLLTLAATCLLAACMSTPQKEAPDNRADPAAKTHLEFARDFKNAGNEAQSRYHIEQAKRAQQQEDDRKCGLLCTLVDEMFTPSQDTTLQDTTTNRPCRDAVTTSPAVESSC